MRRTVAALLSTLVVAVAFLATATATAARAAPPSRSGAIEQLQTVRSSIDETLTLIKAGRVDDAFEVARRGYLDHFEFVEIPLRALDAQFTADVETQFAVIRNAIRDDDPVADIRSEIVTLRAMIDDVERRLTQLGASGPAIVFTQSFMIIFREGLEAVLLISVLLSYLGKAKATRFRRPVLFGMAGAAAASAATFFVLRALLAVAPLGREILEAVTGLFAAVVLFYVSFWLVARMEQRRWLEFLRARIWRAVSVGSTTALLLVGFTSVYREGFETALFYQALAAFGPGLGWWIVAGLGAGIVALVGCAYLILVLGRRIPVKAFLSTAVVLLMVTSVTLLGNAVRALQEADVVDLHRWNDWPQLPIFAAQSLGYWPSRETLVAQGALALVYIVGAVYFFLLRPRLPTRVRATPGRAVAQVQA